MWLFGHDALRSPVMRVLSVPNTKDKISCSLNSFPKDDRNLAADSIATPCGLHAPLITLARLSPDNFITKLTSC